MADTLLSVKTTKAKNPLNAYRSYNYVFTLACLKKDALDDPNSYRQNEDYFVIARSGGKGTTGISAANSVASAMDLVSGFNANSPGRFDFYINNVQLETLMAADDKSSMSLATKIEFDVLEPYSMTGFLEALQVSAVAAGHDQYVNATYLLKMEFLGYPDSEDLPDTAEIVENATRYFVFGFTGLDIDVTQDGARYKCQCVPFNEKGYGEPAVLKSNIQLKGNNVGDILKSFEKGLNESMVSDAKASKDPAQQNLHDSYEIIFPKVDETGIIADSVDESWYQCKVIELLKTPAVYAFSDPGIANNTATTSVRYDPTQAITSFAEKANINECIVSIIRDSEYTKNILKNFPSNVDKNGMVPYFMVHLEMIDKKVVDGTTKKPCYLYRYVVIPYKIHYTRIPMSTDKTVDTSTLVTTVNREYDYLYTGANVDIKSFQLKFNTLFFQAMPAALGNAKDQVSATSGVTPDGSSKESLTDTPTKDSQKSAIGRSTTRTDKKSTQVSPNGIANSGQPNLTDPYAALAKNMHQAILDNVDQCQAEVEIIGDPYYLVTAGMGNYRPEIDPATGAAGEGEAACTTGDVIVLLKFRNPVDIDMVTGEAIFDQTVVPYSGVFRVIQVTSTFNDGVFSQKLQLIRIPAQLIDTNIPVEKQASLTNSNNNPINDATPNPQPVPNTVKATSDSLAASIAAGLPTPGLPGSLSQLVSGVAGAAASVGSLLSQGVAAAGSALPGLSNISSAIRMAASGLSPISTNINSAGASIGQLTATANSAGVSNAANLAQTTLASGLGNATSIGSSAMSSVAGLGSSAAGLVSGVASKISGLTGADASIASSLGVNVSGLSGLSSNLTSSLTKEISDAVKTIPQNVDINLAASKGLILNDIPKTALKNIPATMPISIAPPAIPNLKDLKNILDRGGSLANIPGAANIPGVDKLLAASGNLTLPTGLGLDASSVAGQLSTVQAGLGSITGQIPSVEAGLNNITAMVPSGVPNVSSVASSVANTFGSVSASASSPLSTLIKSVTV